MRHKIKDILFNYRIKYHHWRKWNYIIKTLQRESKADNPAEYSYEKPGVAFSFDDSFRVTHWYKYGKDLFKHYNVKVTFNIDAFHHFDGQRELTQEEIDMLLELQADGHEIAHHSYRHKRAVEYANEFGIEKWLEDEIYPLFDWMEKQSHSITKEKFKKPVTFSFPFFKYNESLVNALVPQHFKLVRGHYLSVNNLVAHNHKGLAPSIGIDQHYLKNIKYVKQILKLAKKTNKNVIFTCHSILPENVSWKDYEWGEESEKAGDWRISPDTLRTIIETAIELGLTFYTTSDIAGVQQNENQIADIVSR